MNRKTPPVVHTVQWTESGNYVLQIKRILCSSLRAGGANSDQISKVLREINNCDPDGLISAFGKHMAQRASFA